MRAAGLLLLVAFVAGSCGGGDGHRAVSPKCVINVYFSPTAPRARALQVAARLRRYERVARVDFVSKQHALRMMRKKFPYLMKGVPRNPLPDALIVWPRSDRERDDVIRALRPPPPGVDVVRPRSSAIRCA